MANIGIVIAFVSFGHLDLETYTQILVNISKCAFVVMKQIQAPSFV